MGEIILSAMILDQVRRYITFEAVIGWKSLVKHKRDVAQMECNSLFILFIRENYTSNLPGMTNMDVIKNPLLSKISLFAWPLP